MRRKKKPLWRVLEPPKNHRPGESGMKHCHYSSRDEQEIREKLKEFRDRFPDRIFQLYRGIFPADE